MAKSEPKQVVVITGASRGIGAATALLAAERGFSVCVNYKSQKSSAHTIVKQIVQEGGYAIAVAADVAKVSDVRNMFARAGTELGPVTALVNNAGILEKQCNFSEINAARLKRIFATNVFGAFNCMQEAIRCMSTAHGGNGGAIVNVSSVAARTGAAHEYVDYAASKGALDSMSSGVAREVAPFGIRVNTVRPGFIQTEMHASGGEPGRVDRLAKNIPLQRGGETIDVARAILWLLSDKAAYATGACIDVTGGV